ncbi:SLBB domain-containing protein [Alteromonas lipolytica]|uniref:Sugar transporter n=1 Tax=Alteromonas lipolytica TaxID=1856405 RepID=A0A1E8FBA6_9ALTE|nr:SLBB domain-containing protein [Alteromonas lipolytica]OFI33066.1 hypothetical protein BFC17_02000 [Alteromonas lipolytica]GGF62775.1 sugar transporter [Alteromonas lipolytica]
MHTTSHYPVSRGLCWLLLLTFALLPAKVAANDPRIGVLWPEDVQRQNAVKAASQGLDEPLAEPAVAINQPNPLTLLPDMPSELEKAVSETLEPITLEEQIQQQVVQSELSQFGYDIFAVTPTTFAPVEGIPVPPDYIIGPGDTFVLQIYGPSDVEYRLVVTREGRLLIPEIGDIQVAGLTFEEAKLTLQQTITKMRIGVKTVITLADLHTIQILMVGDVSRPGMYTVSGLSSLLNTLITTGGVKRTGSLRDIQVRRHNQVVARMDIYNVLLRGMDEDNIYLRQGDVIFVPPIGPTVSIAGEVHRPAIYELKAEQTVADIVALTGGLLPTADIAKSHIERITADAQRTLLTIGKQDAMATLPVRNGDVVRVFPALKRMADVVVLSGHVMHPGGYQWRPGMRVSSVINNVSMLRHSTDFTVAMIQREDRKTKRISVRYFALGDALSKPGSQQDMPLEPRDQLVIFDTQSARQKLVQPTLTKITRQQSGSQLASTFELKGHIDHPGTYPLEHDKRLLDLVKAGGGLRPGTDMQYSLLVRTDPVSKHIGFIRLNLQKAQADEQGDHNPLLQPGDKLYLFGSQTNRAALIADDVAQLRAQTRYGELSPVVTLSGEVVHAGVYPVTPGMRLKDLIAAGGGMTERAFGEFATLSRQALLASQQTTTDTLNISLAGPDQYGLDSNMIVHPYDHLTLRVKPDWVSQPKLVRIEGEVAYPGEYRVGKYDTLCSVVQRAGGFTEHAYLFGAVFLRDSVKQKEQQALDKLFEQLDDLLVDVHLSPGYQKDQKLPVNKGATDILKVMQGLDRPQAVGRMVIDLESAVSRCDERHDIVLENGDRLIVPTLQDEVSVVGQVYQPSSHHFRSDRAAFDYVNLSGGTKQFAAIEHIYIVQANGEVMSVRSSQSSWTWLGKPKNLTVTPGATIYVPLDVDRINGREFSESWAELIYKMAISAAGLKFILND